MFLVMNRLKVKPDHVEELVERFSKSYGLEQTPGFLRFYLLEPAWAPGKQDELDTFEYVSFTEWQSREAFENWVKSDAFKQAHQNTDNSIFDGPAQVVGYQPRVERQADSASKPSTGRQASKQAFVKTLGFLSIFLLSIFVAVLTGCDDSSETQPPAATTTSAVSPHDSAATSPHATTDASPSAHPHHPHASGSPHPHAGGGEDSPHHAHAGHPHGSADGSPHAGHATNPHMATRATGKPSAVNPKEIPESAIVITDDAGRKIVLEEPAERVVAGSSTALELLMTLGEKPVLRPDVAESKVHPAEAKSIPAIRIDHGVGPDLETLAAAQPDLVVLHTHFAAFVPGIERNLEVPVMLLEVTSLDDVTDKLQTLSKATGSTEAHEQRIQAVRENIEQARQSAGDRDVRVLALFGTPEAFFAYRNTSYIGSMIEAVGATNVAAGDPPMGQLRSVAPLDMEQALVRSPDVILVVPHGDPDAVMSYLQSHPIWSQMAAVEQGNVHILDEGLFSSSPGPRAPEAIEQLSQLLPQDAS